MPGKATKIVISERQQSVLLNIVRCPSSTQQLAQRARMILLAFDGDNNAQMAEQVGCERHAVGKWRRRWKSAFEKLISNECSETTKALQSGITDVLADEHRSGCKPKFTPDQVTQIVAIACENPDEQAERPVTHWTPSEIADEASKRGIVE